MSQKNKPAKLINEYSIDELLKLIGSEKQSEENSEISTLTDEEKIENIVIRFLVYYDIKPGRYSINAKLLYKLFKKWAKDNDVSYKQFFLKLSKQFSVKNKAFNYKRSLHFKVNVSLSSITKFFEDNKKKGIHLRRTKNHLRYMEEFLNVHNIKPGPVYIESDILYYMFDAYNYKKKRAGIKYYHFVSMCHLYFKSKQLGYGAMWFGVNEEIKNLITPEWVKGWRQGRVKYGYLSRKKTKKQKQTMYTTKYSTEEIRKRKILYSETLPEGHKEEESEKSDKIPSVKS